MDTREITAQRFAELATAIGAQEQSPDRQEGIDTWREAWPRLYVDCAEEDQDWFNLLLLTTFKDVFNGKRVL